MEPFDLSAVFPPDRLYRAVYVSSRCWNDASYSYLERPRPDSGILLLLQGGMEFSAPGFRLTAAPGDLLYLPQGARYEAVIRPESGQTRDCLINFETQPPAPQPGAPLCLLRDGGEGFRELFAHAIRKKQRGLLGAFGMNELLFALLDRLTTDAKQCGRFRAELDRAQELLEEPGGASVAQIAGQLGVSESGFRALFKKAFGLSPAQYRMHVRLSRAEYLLESTEMTVGDIAEALGFYDEASFCRAFRKHAGLSPKQYGRRKKI